MERGQLLGIAVQVAVPLLASSVALGSMGVVAVSPGGRGGRQEPASEISDGCPTFSWSLAADGSESELAVLEVAEGGALESARVVWRRRVAAGATAWTPSRADCLEAGREFAWVVRAVASGDEWSAPLFFRVPAAPTDEEVGAALALLERWQSARAAAPSVEPGGEERKPAKADSAGARRAAAGESSEVPTVGGVAAIRGENPDASGAALGILGVCHSPQGAGVVARNESAGADLILDGAAQGEADTLFTQGGIDRPAAGAQTFNIANSGAGAMTLQVDGAAVDTALTPIEWSRLASVPAGFLDGIDNDTTYTPGNQLQLAGNQFDLLEGPGSTLDADTLDGLDATAFLGAGADSWVNTTGDTMTGTLAIDVGAGFALQTGAGDSIDVGGDIYKSGLKVFHAGGPGNVGVGTNALGAVTSGLSNTGVGADALRDNASGSNNVAVGPSALKLNSGGSGNTAVGSNALATNTAGAGNVAVGMSSLAFNTGDVNTAVGFTALNANSTGSNNVAMGYRALSANLTANGNTAIGAGALEGNTLGSNNVAVGVDASGNSNASDNTALGAFALASNSGGTRNVAVGRGALQANINALENTAVGAFALDMCTTGNYNVAVGGNALGAVSTGFENTAIGAAALLNTTANLNIGIGYAAGINFTTGGFNIAIGNNGVAGDGATTRIGSSQTRTFISGIRGVTTGVANGIPVLIDSAGQLGTVSSSARYKEEIADLGAVSERLLALRPVRFRYRPEVQAGERPIEYGLIAEEVARVFPELVVYDAAGRPETVRYQVLSTLLVNELEREHERGLGRDRQIARLASELAALRARLDSAAGGGADGR